MKSKRIPMQKQVNEIVMKEELTTLNWPNYDRDSYSTKCWDKA